ncbi:hypothetical protein YC2023_086380 [Brassica napus]
MEGAIWGSDRRLTTTAGHRKRGSDSQMREFYLSWFQLFCCFIFTFTVSPCLPIIRELLNIMSQLLRSWSIQKHGNYVHTKLREDKQIKFT